MLRIAVPNKGSLSEPAVEMLHEAGYKVRRDPRELTLLDPDNDVEFFYLRPRDIAIYVGSGTVDAGITGRDLLLDSGSSAVEVISLGFGGSTFRYAAPAGAASSVADVGGRRVATSYPGLVQAHLDKAGVRAYGRAPRRCGRDGRHPRCRRRHRGCRGDRRDLAWPGTGGLRRTDLRSEAVLIRRVEVPEDNGAGVLRRRLQGVVTARHYVMMDYDVPAELVDQACAVTPGLESPTVSPLQDPAWKAVRAMVPRSMTNRVMDELYDVGARAILVTDIAACRL